jgi:hypothetical protein
MRGTVVTFDRVVYVAAVALGAGVLVDALLTMAVFGW